MDVHRSDFKEGLAWLVEMLKSTENTPVKQHVRMEPRRESIPKMCFTKGWNQAWEHLMTLEEDCYWRTQLSGNIKSLKLV